MEGWGPRPPTPRKRTRNFGIFAYRWRLLSMTMLCAGLWMAATGFNYISRGVIHPLHVIW